MLKAPLTNLLRRLFTFESNTYRGIPMFFHLAIVATMGAFFRLYDTMLLELLRKFNNWEFSVSEFPIAAALGFSLYIVFLAVLASTKAILDWMLDGK